MTATSTITSVEMTEWATTVSPRQSTAAARVVDAVKTYGRGANEVHALAGVSVDFAESHLVPTLTAVENITLPANLAGAKVDQARLTAIVNTVGPADRQNHHPSELSGGQQQRVAMTRALATRPQIIFADEPTGNLDSRSGSEVLSFIRDAVHEFGQTIAMVTHDAVAACYADRAMFLADGRVVADPVLNQMRHIGE